MNYVYQNNNLAILPDTRRKSSRSPRTLCKHLHSYRVSDCMGLTGSHSFHLVDKMSKKVIFFSVHIKSLLHNFFHLRVLLRDIFSFFERRSCVLNVTKYRGSQISEISLSVLVSYKNIQPVFTTAGPCRKPAGFPVIVWPFVFL